MDIRSLLLLLTLFPLLGFCPVKQPAGVERDVAKLTNILRNENRDNDVEITPYPNFTDNSLLSTKMQKLMFPYLVPLDHPLKPILDGIFSRAKGRAIEDEASLTRAGFSILFSQKRSFIIVAKHRQAPGYLFKIYLDSRHVRKNGLVGWELLTTRCFVAQKIKNIIEKKGIRHFTIADKWLYPLPIPGKGVYANCEPVILVVKDMNIYNRPISKKAWYTKPTKGLLRELYAILGRGYGSAYLHANIPFSKNNTFAFIDTEYNKDRVSMQRVRRFLSPPMQKYWDKLTKKKLKVQAYSCAAPSGE